MYHEIHVIALNIAPSVWQKYSLLCSLNRTRFSSTSGVVWWQFHLALDAQETHVAPAGFWGCDFAQMGLAYTEQHEQPQGSQTSHKTETGWVKAIWKTSSHHHRSAHSCQSRRSQSGMVMSPLKISIWCINQFNLIISRLSAHYGGVGQIFKSIESLKPL